MTALLNKHYSGYRKATEVKDKTAKEHLERDLEQDMGTAGFKYSWRKMQVAA